MRNRFILLQMFCLLALLIRCSVDPVAGGSDNPDFIVTGSINDSCGRPASNTVVTILPRYFNPLADSAELPLAMDTTDSSGRYRLSVSHRGVYTLQAVENVSGLRLLVNNISVTTDTSYVKSANLSIPGLIEIVIPENSNDLTSGYMYIPGTTIYAQLLDDRERVVVDSVPPGVISVLVYNPPDTTSAMTVRQEILVESGKTTVISNPFWKYSTRIFLNTTATGADVDGDVFDFPVLIRLNGDNFDFSKTLSGGADLRFSKSDQTALSFEIERWDPGNQCAEVWVRTDTVYGNDSTQFIILYWGNQNSGAVSNSAAVFDTSLGYQGVWHLGDEVYDSISDATANMYHGSSPKGARPSVGEGIIGNCLVFDGVDDFILMENTASSTLDFPQEGKYSISAWVYIDAFDNRSHCIVSKGYEQYYMRLTYFPTNSPLWEFVQFSETVNWQVSSSSASSGEWIFLTGVRDGASQMLYCNGVLVDSTTDNWPQGYMRNTSNDLTIGRFLEEVTFPTNDGFCFYKGSIDEVRIMDKAYGTEWIRLSYMNQRKDDRLVVFR